MPHVRVASVYSETDIVTRFAPSPTGPLHLGHAFAAIVAHDIARAAKGRFLLRIEDIDQSRARPAWEALIVEDLHWLGLTWDGPVMRQSDRLPAYRAALTRLWQRGLVYPCTCTRRDILDAASAPQEGVPPHIGPDGPVYPGTCRTVPPPDAPLPEATLRLNMARAVAALSRPLSFVESGCRNGSQEIDITHLLHDVGDVVLTRREMGTSYHLAVVVDDAAQGVTHVTRGEDLFEATPIHVLLQHLLDLPVPCYHHHALIRDARGKRLAKRDDARAIQAYRQDGLTPQQVRGLVGQ